jgi:hypothetical protein
MSCMSGSLNSIITRVIFAEEEEEEEEDCSLTMHTEQQETDITYHQSQTQLV